jgi:hypothetical protein
MNIFMLILVLLGGGSFLYFLEKMDSFNSKRNFIDLDDLENDLKNCKTALDILKIRERCWVIRQEYSGYLSWVESDRIHEVIKKCNKILYEPGHLKRDEDEELKMKITTKNLNY